ncbi:MAG: KEOPS complex subunit Pcc1 [Candidatus Bathyarchaeia archaeon]
MEADAKIILVYESAEEASAISHSVSPDNLTCPEGLSVETQSSGGNVITIIKYCGENIATFLSTIDDLLGCVSTAEKAIGIVKEKGNR